MSGYPAAFVADDAGGFTVVFADFPLDLAEGRTMDHALKNARIMLHTLISARLDRGEPIPKPSPACKKDVIVPLLWKTVDLIKECTPNEKEVTA